MLDQTASASANRRVFRSKVDALRPTYGFEDVSLAPGHEHDRAGRRRARPGRSAASTLAIPILAVGDGRRRRSAASPGRSPRSAASRSSTSRASRRATTSRTTILGRIAAAPDGEVQDLLAEAYAQPIREELIARRIEEIHAAGLEGRGGGHARRGPPVRPVLRRARRRSLPRPEPGQQRPPPRVGLRPAVARGVHPVHADPGRGRQHDEQRCGVRADGAGRRGRVRRRRARRRMHDPRGPRDRRAAGDRDQRRRRRPRRVPRRDRPLRPGRRRRRDAPRRRAGEGDRRRRGRADDRLAAGPRRGGARAAG